MILSFPFSLLLLLLWALGCALQDARQRRIDNRLIMLGTAGALLHLVLLRQSATGSSPASVVLACVLALAFTVPGYRSGKLGGGDVKLLFTLALASGPPQVLLTVAGAAAFLVLWVSVAEPTWKRLPPGLRRTVPALAPPVTTPPYAPFVFAGLLCALLLS